MTPISNAVATVVASAVTAALSYFAVRARLHSELAQSSAAAEAAARRDLLTSLNQDRAELRREIEGLQNKIAHCDETILQLRRRIFELEQSTFVLQRDINRLHAENAELSARLEPRT
jgi:peptidoglycan hydrolase CwlO-like protein